MSYCRYKILPPQSLQFSTNLVFFATPSLNRISGILVIYRVPRGEGGRKEFRAHYGEFGAICSHTDYEIETAILHRRDNSGTDEEAVTQP